MADEMTPDRVEQKARQALEPGLKAVRALAQVRLELAEVQQRDAAAYQEAARFFTPEQLKGFGFGPPVKRVQGRPASGGRGRRTRSVDVSGAPSALGLGTADPAFGPGGEGLAVAG